MKRLLGLALLLWLPSSGIAADYYFVTVFGSQRRLKQQ